MYESGASTYLHFLHILCLLFILKLNIQNQPDSFMVYMSSLLFGIQER